MSEYSDLTGPRDWSTPLPWTGKPYVKTYWDWLRCCYRTDVCILLGAREEAPGTAWSDRAENAGKGRAPDLDRRDLSPQGQRTAVNAKQARPGPRAGAVSLRTRVRAHLAAHPGATPAEIAAKLPMHGIDSIRTVLNTDATIERISVGKKGDSSRWRLKAVQHAE